jgi:hypothetical protein
LSIDLTPSESTDVMTKSDFIKIGMGLGFIALAIVLQLAHLPSPILLKFLFAVGGAFVSAV